MYRDPNDSLLPEDEAIEKVTKFVKVHSKQVNRPKRNLDSKEKTEKEIRDRKKQKDDLPSDDDPM